MPDYICNCFNCGFCTTLYSVLAHRQSNLHCLLTFFLLYLQELFWFQTLPHGVGELTVKFWLHKGNGQARAGNFISPVWNWWWSIGQHRCGMPHQQTGQNGLCKVLQKSSEALALVHQQQHTSHCCLCPGSSKYAGGPLNKPQYEEHEWVLNSRHLVPAFQVFSCSLWRCICYRGWYKMPDFLQLGPFSPGIIWRCLFDPVDWSIVLRVLTFSPNNNPQGSNQQNTYDALVTKAILFGNSSASISQYVSLQLLLVPDLLSQIHGWILHHALTAWKIMP